MKKLIISGFALALLFSINLYADYGCKITLFVNGAPSTSDDFIMPESSTYVAHPVSYCSTPFDCTVGTFISTPTEEGLDVTLALAKFEGEDSSEGLTLSRASLLLQGALKINATAVGNNVNVTLDCSHL